MAADEKKKNRDTRRRSVVLTLKSELNVYAQL